jgi:hypothetical protein
MHSSFSSEISFKTWKNHFFETFPISRGIIPHPILDIKKSNKRLDNEIRSKSCPRPKIKIAEFYICNACSCPYDIF